MPPIRALRKHLPSPFLMRKGLTVMASFSPLDDPVNASFAWARYRLLMKWMGAFAGLVVLAVLVLLYFWYGFVSIHLYIATALGVGLTIMLMAALMGLVFLSSGTGHDESIEDPFEDMHNG
jgi:hypothetical protein